MNSYDKKALFLKVWLRKLCKKVRYLKTPNENAVLFLQMTFANKTSFYLSWRGSDSLSTRRKFTYES